MNTKKKTVRRKIYNLTKRLEQKLSREPSPTYFEATDEELTKKRISYNTVLEADNVVRKVMNKDDIHHDPLTRDLLVKIRRETR